MKETPDNNLRHHHLPSRFKVTGFALTLAGALGLMLFASISFAQTERSDPEPSLVYIADSENPRLNRRLRELLSAAFDESVMIRSFVAGQTSQDSESPVIAIGPTAFSLVREENRQVPVLGLLVDEAYVSQRDQQAGKNISAVLSTPLLLRQAAIGRVILPYANRVAMLARPSSEHLYNSVLDDLEALGMEGRVFLVPADDRLIPTLIRALSYGDFILAAPDAAIYNPTTIKHILLTAYRRNRIVIGPSHAYVKAGALASSYSPLSEIASMASDYVRHFWQLDEFPAPAHPAKFGIEINRQVGKSLNIPLPERQNLIDNVAQRLRLLEAPSDE